MRSWKHEEVALWMRSMLREEFPHVATFLILMAESVLKRGFLTPSEGLIFLLPLSITIVLFGCVKRLRRDRDRFRAVFTYYQVVQTFLLCKNFFGPTNIFDLYASAVLMVQYELTPLHSAFVNASLVAKDTVAWSFIVSKQDMELKFNSEYIMATFWSFFHLFNYLSVRKGALANIFLNIKNLQREQQRLEALLQAIPDGVAVVTDNKEVVAFNKSLLQQLRLEEKSSIGGEIVKKLSELKYLPEYTKNKVHSESLLDDILNFIGFRSSKEDNFGVFTLSGVIFELRGRFCMWDQSSACVVIVRNITHWVDLERKAQRESASKTALLRSVSHELRTPTNVILNLAREIQEHESLTCAGHASLQMMTISTNFLLSIINDLLDFSRIITGNFKLTKQRCRPQQVVQECIMLIRHQCNSKGVDLKLFYDSLIPETCFTDQNRLKQVLLNLLSNAVKFTMKGTIEVSAMLNYREMMTISVKDSGIGIPEGDQEKIFRLFGKLEGYESLNPQGCGLGLSISNHIVESLSGGRITVKSAPGKGSIFSFDVDIGLNAGEVPKVVGDCVTDIPEDELLEIKLPIDSFDSKLKNLRNSQVLIVDDSDFNRIVARKMIEARGLSCDEGLTGLQALHKIKEMSAAGTPYKLVLMDVEMPEMDGITATREIRRSSDISEQPLIVGCSAYSSQEDRDLCISAGMNQYIEKPVSRDQLYELLNSFAVY